jgi:peptidyl-prolyl cis-trans isomerase A (cyclophilin A)
MGMLTPVLLHFSGHVNFFPGVFLPLAIFMLLAVLYLYNSNRMKKLILAFTFLLTAFAGFSKDKKPKLEPGLYAEMETTKGKILLTLEFEKTPLTVANFVGLAEGRIANTAKPAGTPYYDDITFHRVIPNFMIQGGDPLGNGTGGPGYSFKDEFLPEFKFTGPGILAMANAGPGTNGSQFFITHVATPWLDQKHTIFGHVITGQEVVNAIQQGDKIVHIKIIRKGKAAKKFKAPKVFEELKNK